MSELSALYGLFHGSILANDAAPVVPAIKPNPRISARRQLAIYIEGYRTRLIQAIRADYPALLALIGDTEFDRLALAYSESHPPEHYNLDRYPHGFSAFILSSPLPLAGGAGGGNLSVGSESVERFPHPASPASGGGEERVEPYTNGFPAAVAALEGAIAGVFMQAESPALGAAALTGLTPEALGRLRLKPRAASRLLHLHYPAEAYLAALREGHAPALPAPEDSYLYVVRHRNEVKRHALSQAEYLVLAQLYAGQSVGDALDCVTQTHPALILEIAENLQNWFARWTEQDFFFT